MKDAIFLILFVFYANTGLPQENKKITFPAGDITYQSFLYDKKINGSGENSQRFITRSENLIMDF